MTLTDLRRIVLVGLFMVIAAHLFHDLPARMYALEQQAEEMGEW